MRFKNLPLLIVFFSILLTAPVFPLEVASLEFNTYEIGKYQKLQISFDLDREFRNPFNPEEIRADAFFTSPAGKLYTVPAFYIVEHQLYVDWVDYKKPNGDIKKVDIRRYQPQGKGHWQIRFSPDTEGEWQCQIVITAGSSSQKYPVDAPIKFTCIPTNEPGFLHPDPQNSHYLRFDDGSFFFGVGFNAVNTMGACFDGEVRSFEVMQKMAAKGGNMAQIDLCQGDYLEWTAEEQRRYPYYQAYQNLGRYNQQVASQIDRAVALAESLGVYLRFSFYHWADFGESPADGAPGFQTNPYWDRNGGPCRKPDQFFTDREAWEYQKKLFRYIAARWGYSTHIICWELWNEVDNTLNYEVKPVGNWHRKAADFLKSLDGQHMVTTSASDITKAPPLFRSFEADLVTFHDYVFSSADRPFNIVDNMLSDYGVMQPLNKPIIPGEFGYETDVGMGEFIRLAVDSTGLDLHNQMWAALMEGMAAAAMPWGWGKYIDHYNLYYHCVGIARFMAGEDLGEMQSFGADNLFLKCDERQLKFPVIEVPTREEKVRGQRPRGYYEKRQVPDARVLGLISPNKALVWVQDQGSAWVSYAPLDKVEGVTLTVKGMDDGRVKIEYWNTFKGIITGQTLAEVSGNKLIIELPSFKNDLAMKIYHLAGN